MESIVRIELDRLHESPTNPRKHFNAEALQELADNIKAHGGVLSPVLVRPHPRLIGYEVVFGHRRVRASRLAGLEDIRAEVREMSDLEVRLAQISENLARQDVSAIEEADGYDCLLREHGYTVAQIIESTGKSKSYIYARLKLVSLVPAARKACQDGLIDAEVATMIGRLHPALQPTALQRVCYKGADGEVTSMSYRQARGHLQNSFTVKLVPAEITFDPADDTLPPQACTGCSRNSDNDPDLQSAFGAGVCTNADCAEKKDEAVQQRKLDELQAAGRLLDDDQVEALPEGSARGHEWFKPAIGSYIRYTDAVTELGEDAPEMASLFHKTGSGLIQHFTAEHAQAIRDALNNKRGVPEEDASTGESEPSHLYVDTRTPEERLVRDYDTWSQIKRSILRDVAESTRTVDDLRTVCAALVSMLSISHDVQEEMGWTGDNAMLGGYEGTVQTWVREKLPSMGADDLAKLMVLLAIDSNYFETAERLNLAAQRGVCVFEATGTERPAANTAAEPDDLLTGLTPADGDEESPDTEGATSAEPAAADEANTASAETTDEPEDAEA